MLLLSSELYCGSKLLLWTIIQIDCTLKKKNPHLHASVEYNIYRGDILSHFYVRFASAISTISPADVAECPPKQADSY